MENFLDEGTGYEIRTIAEGIDDPADLGKRDRSLGNLKTIEEKFSEYESGLKGKRVPTDEEFFDTYRHAIKVLRDYFYSEGTKVKRPDADIYYFYLVEKREKFREFYRESAEE